MKKRIILLILIIYSNNLISQVDAPSKLPSERLDSEYFNDTSVGFSNSQHITLVNNAGDDSATLQTVINTLSEQGGGVIKIPSGIWELGEIKILSDVHLMFDENAVVKPVLSQLDNKSIFLLGFTGSEISNISIRAISGKFTIDMTHLPYNETRITPFNVKNVKNFMVAGCFVKDKRTIHATMNCGVSPFNGVWSGPKNGLIKDITVHDAHDGYGAIQVRVGEHLYFKNIESLLGGSTLRIETDAHEASNAPREFTRISEISGYNIKCNQGNSALMIQPWGMTNGWFDVEKVQATSCGVTVRIDRAFTGINDEHIGSFDSDSRITNVISTYGTKAHVKDGNIKSIPCSLRDLVSPTPIEGTNGRFFATPTIAPILYNASHTVNDDPRYYKVHIPSENQIKAHSFNFPENSLMVSRWNNTNPNCVVNTEFRYVKSLTVTPEVMNIKINETKYLEKTIKPKNATNHGVSWVSDNESVAFVDQWGAVTGIKDGTATITINTTDGNFVQTVTVNVEKTLSTADIHKNEISVKIYPNPFKQEDVNIDLGASLVRPRIAIYNLNGQLLFEKKYSNRNKIVIHESDLELSKGIYLITIKSSNQFLSKKLIVN